MSAIPFYDASLNLSTAFDALFLLLTGSVAYLAGLYYFSLDRKTKKYDEKVRNTIRTDPAFSGITEAAETEIEPTSDSTLSKGITVVKELGGDRTKPDKVVKVDGETELERREEILFERAKEIPGKNILRPNIVGAIRNYFAYKIALDDDEYSGDVAKHFKDKLEEYDCSAKITQIAKPDRYEDVVLIDESNGADLDPLNDIFLDLVSAAEKYCVDPHSHVNDKEDAIEECREFLMLALWSLWTNNMRGVKVQEDKNQDRYIGVYRDAAKADLDWTLWVMPCKECDESEFKRIRHLGWKINDIVDQHWDDEFSTHHSHGNSIRNMEFVPEPFVVYQKEESVIRGGANDSN